MGAWIAVILASEWDGIDEFATFDSSKLGQLPGVLFLPTDRAFLFVKKKESTRSHSRSHKSDMCRVLKDGGTSVQARNTMSTP